MANLAWILRTTLENLESDVIHCERLISLHGHVIISHNELGTLRVNLNVVNNALSVATAEQGMKALDLSRRAEKILKRKV
jgi:hypothetical protein